MAPKRSGPPSQKPGPTITGFKSYEWPSLPEGGSFGIVKGMGQSVRFMEETHVSVHDFAAADHFPFDSGAARPSATPAQAGDAGADSEDPLVKAAVAAVIERVPEIVRARQEQISQENIDRLVDAYLKSAPTAGARHQIEMDNARERARFVEEFPCYSSREVAELAGHEAANASATATRWKKAGRIIGLPWKGSDLYPAFQFSEGRPRPIIGRLIEALIGMSPWQIAFWLTSSNSWLGGAAPLDRLGEEDAVVGAATRESAVLGG